MNFEFIPIGCAQATPDEAREVITLPSLARENNNSPPARTAALLQNGQQVLPSIAFKGQ